MPRTGVHVERLVGTQRCRVVCDTCMVVLGYMGSYRTARALAARHRKAMHPRATKA